MRFFLSGDFWNRKFNWVDENNIVVGFDADSSCCEFFGYAYLKEKPIAPINDLQSLSKLPDFDLSDYRIDPNFHESPDGDLEQGKAALFRLVKLGNPQGDRFLLIFNSHNGYYSHGLTATKQNSPWIDESL